MKLEWTKSKIFIVNMSTLKKLESFFHNQHLINPTNRKRNTIDVLGKAIKTIENAEKAYTAMRQALSIKQKEITQLRAIIKSQRDEITRCSGNATDHTGLERNSSMGKYKKKANYRVKSLKYPSSE